MTVRTSAPGLGSIGAPEQTSARSAPAGGRSLAPAADPPRRMQAAPRRGRVPTGGDASVRALASVPKARAPASRQTSSTHRVLQRAALCLSSVTDCSHALDSERVCVCPGLGATTLGILGVSTVPRFPSTSGKNLRLGSTIVNLVTSPRHVFLLAFRWESDAQCGHCLPLSKLWPERLRRLHLSRHGRAPHTRHVRLPCARALATFWCSGGRAQVPHTATCRRAATLPGRRPPVCRTSGML